MNSDYRKGPAEVAGKQNHEVIVKHGGSIMRVHPVSPHLVDEQISHGDTAGETEGIVTVKEIIIKTSFINCSSRGSGKNKSFCLQGREVYTVTKQELAYDWKSSSKP